MIAVLRLMLLLLNCSNFHHVCDVYVKEKNLTMPKHQLMV